MTPLQVSPGGSGDPLQDWSPAPLSLQRDGGLGGEQQEGESLLQVQANNLVGVARIADGEVLADPQVEVAATGGQHESAGNGGSPDDLFGNKTHCGLQD